MHAERTRSTPKILTQTVLSEFHACCYSAIDLRPARPNERLFIDDTVSRLSGRHCLSIKKAAENAIDKRRSKACCVCSAKGKRTAKGGYLKTKFFVNFVPQNQVYTLNHASRSIILRLTSLYGIFAQ